MPALLSSIELSDYFHGGPQGLGNVVNTFSPFGKSIQKSFRYLVSFFPDLFPNDQRKKLYLEIGMMPIIRSWHVKSISIPQYSFDKEQQYYGPVPRSFPILKHDGFEVKIEFEEDDRGTIGCLINWLQRAPINSENGLYRAPDAVKIPLIGVISEDDNGIPIGIYTLHDSFYLNADGPDFDYSESVAIKYSVTMNCDIINSFYPKAEGLRVVSSTLTQAAGNLLSTVL